MQNMQQSRFFRDAVVPVVFALLVFAVWLPLLRNGFINFDDPPYVLNNDHVLGGLTAGGIAWAFTAFHSYNWHPLTWISHMVDVQLFGLNPMGHHLMNALLHTANALLLFAFLKRLSGRYWESLLVAALFAVHPLRVESVAWVAERKDVLSTLFLFLTLWLYAGYREKGGGARYAGVMASFAAGLMAKPMLVTLPVLLLLLDLLPVEGSGGGELWRPTRVRRMLLEKVPFFLLAGLSAAVTLLAQNQGGTGAIVYESPFRLNAGNALISYVRYIGKLAWPDRLAILYPFRVPEINAVTVTASMAVLLAATAAAAWQAKKRPYLLLGWLWYLVSLLPVIGLVRIGRHSIADRYTYVPSVGLLLIVVWGGAELVRRRRVPAQAVAAASAALLLLLAGVTVRQEGYWESSITLFRHALDVTEDNALAHKNLGLAYGEVGDAAGAAREGALGRMFDNRDISCLYPDNPEVLYRLATSYMELERYREAVQTLTRVVQLAPASSKVYNELGIACAQAGMLDEARAAFQQALRIDPGNTQAQFNYRQVLSGQGR